MQNKKENFIHTIFFLIIVSVNSVHAEMFEKIEIVETFELDESVDTFKTIKSVDSIQTQSVTSPD